MKKNTKLELKKDVLHKYVHDGKDVEYSVTEYIDLFLPEFDADNVLDKLGVDNPFMRVHKKEYWNITALAGTFVHNQLELFVDIAKAKGVDYARENLEEYISLLGKNDIFYSRLSFDVQSAIFNASEVVSNILEQVTAKYSKYTIETELSVVGKLPNGITVAGSIDLAIDTPKKTYLIDYKTTNKSLDVSYDKCKAPIEHLEASRLNKYSLQLAMYEYLIKQNFKEIKSKEVSKIILKVPLAINSQASLHKAVDLDNELQAILDFEVA